MRTHELTERSHNQSPIQRAKAKIAALAVPFVAALSLLMSPGIALGHAHTKAGAQMGAGQGMDHMSQMDGGPMEAGQLKANEHQPYAGMQTRLIKALSERERDGLMSGKGIGYALAAELNHYPGPRHILDMTGPLELSPAQIANTQGVFDRMEATAISLGESIVDKEAALDAAFATEEIDRNKLETLVSDIARLEGKLRIVHLSTHLEMKRILSPEQVGLYDQMRGYVPKPKPGMVHGGKHQD